MHQQSMRVIAWSILGCLLFLAGVGYVEQVVPQLETETYDENALEKLASLSLIESQPKINSSPVCLLSLTTATICTTHSFGSIRFDKHLNSPSNCPASIYTNVCRPIASDTFLIVRPSETDNPLAWLLSMSI